MKSLFNKLGLVLGLVLLFSFSTEVLATDPPAIDNVVNLRMNEGTVCCTVTLAECCQFESDFGWKKNNALRVLKAGCGEAISVTRVGDYTYYDFRPKNNEVARLVTNKKDKTIMLVTYKFKKNSKIVSS
ncbi:MAG: hypothetical protein ABFR62_13775 [Bacteroidota bacterium]